MWEFFVDVGNVGIYFQKSFLYYINIFLILFYTPTLPTYPQIYKIIKKAYDCAIPSVAS